MSRSFASFALVASFIAMLVTTSGCGASLQQRQAAERTSRRNAFIERGVASSVRIRAIMRTPEDSVGSGAIIGDGRHVLTAYHVVKDSVMILAATGSAELHGADQWAISYHVPVLLKLVRFSEELDVALLETEYGAPISSAALSTFYRQVHPLVGDEVWHFGIETGVSHGKVLMPEDTLIKFSAAVDEGDSGGPAIMQDGELFGIVVQGDPKKHLVYAVSIGDALVALGL